MKVAEDSAAQDDALLALLAAGLRLQANDTLWRVSGNTLPHRTLLRDAGGTWNRLDMCWEFTGEDPTTKLAAALESAPAIGHNSAAATEPKPHYHGHRGRVRERVLKSGADGLEDYELLELLLFYAIERIDTKPLAKRLIERFGTLGDLFAAEPAHLRDFDIDQRTLVLFRALREAGRRLAAPEGREEAGAGQLAAAHRLLPHHAGAREDRALRHPVPEPQERADRRRGAAARHGRPHAGLSSRGGEARAAPRGERPDPGAQSSVGRSQAVARRHRDDQGDPRRRRAARHRNPRSPRHRPQGPCELQEVLGLL